MEAWFERALQSLTSGVMIGCVYGLMCLGLGLIFGVMRIVNFAQGEFMMLGMYGGMLLIGLAALAPGAFLPYVAIFAVALCTALIAALVYKVTLAPKSSQQGTGNPNAQLILTLGISLVLQNAMMMWMGSEARSIRTPFTTSAWEFGMQSGLSIFINQGRLVSALLSVAAAVMLVLLFQRTALGRSLRAAADTPEAAVYCGVDTARACLVAFAVGAGTTALAGGLLATNYPFNPFVGLDFIVIMYAGVVLGGMGSIAGAFGGGFTIGVVQQMAGLVLPMQLQNTAIFVVFLAVVMFKPEGFFGRNIERA